MKEKKASKKKNLHTTALFFKDVIESLRELQEIKRAAIVFAAEDLQQSQQAEAKDTTDTIMNNSQAVF